MVTTAKFTLMNRTVELFDVEMYNNEKVVDICNIRLHIRHFFPYILMNVPEEQLPSRVEKWLEDRSLAASDIHLNKLGEESAISAALSSRLFNLSDQYWARFDPSEKWEDLNFFTNDFSGNIGRCVLEGHASGDLNPLDPILSTGGMLPKGWEIRKGRRVLLKGELHGSQNRESFREVFASSLFSQVLRPTEFAKYILVDEGGKASLSCCETFVTPYNELTSIYEIIMKENIDCWNLTYEDLKPLYTNKLYMLDWMLLIDRTILNTDRHLNNFGFLRSAVSGELLRPAPIFDTGSSLFHQGGKLSTDSISLKPFQGDWDIKHSGINFPIYREGLLKIKSTYEQLFHEAFSSSEEYTDKHWREQILAILSNNITHLLNKCR